MFILHVLIKRDITSSKYLLVIAIESEIFKNIHYYPLFTLYGLLLHQTCVNCNYHEGGRSEGAVESKWQQNKYFI